MKPGVGSSLPLPTLPFAKPSRSSFRLCARHPRLCTSSSSVPGRWEIYLSDFKTSLAASGCRVKAPRGAELICKQPSLRFRPSSPSADQRLPWLPGRLLPLPGPCRPPAPPSPSVEERLPVARFLWGRDKTQRSWYLGSKGSSTSL